jgi:hypothetical protein
MFEVRWVLVSLAFGSSALSAGCESSTPPATASGECPTFESDSPMVAWPAQFHEWDGDSDACLSGAEFEALFAPHFELLDSGGAGVLSADQLRSYFHGLGELDVSVDVDPNGDGDVTPAEWSSISRQLVPVLDEDSDGCVTCGEVMRRHEFFWGG